MRPILVRFNHSTDLIANRYRVVGLGLGAGSLKILTGVLVHRGSRDTHETDTRTSQTNLKPNPTHRPVHYVSARSGRLQSAATSLNRGDLAEQKCEPAQKERT